MQQNTKYVLRVSADAYAPAKLEDTNYGSKW